MEGRPVPQDLLSSLTPFRDAVFVKDLEGRYLLLNEVAAAIVGRDESEVLGRTDAELFPPDVASALREHDEAVLRKGEPMTAEELMVVDGEIHAFLTTKAPLRDAEGRTIGVIGTATDSQVRRLAEEELRRSEEMLAEAQTLTSVGSWRWELVEDTRAWSRQLYEILGLEPGSPPLTWEQFLEHVHNDDRASVREAMDRSLADGSRFEVEHRFIRPDGEERVLSCTARVELDLDGSPKRITGACQDLTERRGEEQLLRAREAQLNAAQELTGVGSWQWDLQTGTVEWSDNLFRVFGVTKEGFAGTYEAYLELIHPDDREKRHEDVRHVLETGEPLRNEHRIVCPSGDVRLIEATASLITDGEGRQRMIGAVQDVTEVRRVEKELARKALEDHVTGLGNRALAYDRLEHALNVAGRRGATVAVLYLDIDGFKRVNDLHGHATGDQLLRDIGNRLNRAVRGSDTLARVGGDEFLVICEDLARLEDANEITRRVKACFAEEFTVAGESLRVTASVGTAFAGDRLVSVDQLVGEADAAMYRAKGGEPGRDPG